MARLIEQTIKLEKAITNGSSDAIEIPIPKDVEVYLKGYGYTWNNNTTYQLSTGNTTFPSRTDQEGSIAQPVIFSTPYTCRPGSTLKLSITNSGDSTDFFAVFYILTSQLLDIESTGSNLTFDTGLEFQTNVLSGASFTESGAMTKTGSVSNTFDLDVTTYVEYKKTDAGQTVQTITFDLGSSKTIKTTYANISWNIGTGGAPNPQGIFKLQISDDNVDYTDIYEADSYDFTAIENEEEASVSARTYRYLRLSIDINNLTTAQTSYYRINELKAIR